MAKLAESETRKEWDAALPRLIGFLKQAGDGLTSVLPEVGLWS